MIYFKILNSSAGNESEFAKKMTKTIEEENVKLNKLILSMKSEMDELTAENASLKVFYIKKI